MNLCDMNEQELKDFLDEIQEEIDEHVELNNIALDLVKLANQKKQIEEELNRRLRYVEKALKC